MRTTITLLALALGWSATLAQDAKPQTWDFEDAAPGKLPSGWTAAKTGEGDGSIWKVTEDKSAPNGARVLAQTAAGPRPLFNLCIADGTSFADVRLSVAFKAVAGEIDQGGGVVWRLLDANNYYIARYNPLENNYRLYKVVDGKRVQLATKESLKAPAAEWHTLAIEMKGDAIECLLNGTKKLEATDSTFTKAGKIGLWTKADAQTHFDRIEVKPTARQSLAQSEAPSKALVVNTQDASVSLVNLKTMKEERRFPVGQRPYGIAVTADARMVAVGVEDEEAVKFFALPDFEPQGKVPIGKMFNDHLVLTPDGSRMLLANFYSDDVVVIDPASMKEVGRIEGCSAPHVVKYGPLKKHAYVTCKKITGIAIIDPAKEQLVKFHQLNVNPRSLTFAPDESKVYFGSFWVNGFFEMDTETGKVTRLLSLDPPATSSGNQEVTYHGVEAVSPNIVLAANEGRSYVDSVDVKSGQQLDRLTSAAKPCCIERIPGTSPVNVLISNLADGSLQMVEVAENGKLTDLGRAKVGAAPKRVAFLPASAK